MFNQKKPRIWFRVGSFLLLLVSCLLLSTPPAYATSAGEAFRAAYENRYTWDQDFPGYKAEVSINYQGELDQGIVRVRPDYSVELVNIDTEEVEELIKDELKMEIIHRRSVPFSELHDLDSFTLLEEEEDGTLDIKEEGKEDNSTYKVKDQVITQVNRELEDVEVQVDTIGVTPTPEGYLVVQFQTTFQEKGRDQVLERQDVRDFYEKIGNYYFLTYRAIRSTTEEDPADKLTPDTIIRFNDFQPLEPSDSSQSQA